MSMREKSDSILKEVREIKLLIEQLSKKMKDFESFIWYQSTQNKD